MEELIKKFLDVCYGDGYGSGSGSGFGDGDGYGCGEGDGYGSGEGDGYGSGSGFGYGYVDGEGDGSGTGDGSGFGYGYGDGSGSGSGYGYGLSTYNGQKIYIIDKTATLIDSVHGQYARGSIVNSDLTLTLCYIARCGNYFAHGATLEEAVRDAEAKALKNEPIGQRIERFKSNYPDVDASVANSDLYKWHNVLTGSCELGRKQFARDHSIDIEHGSMTVREFIVLTKDAFGGQVINQLKAAYNI